MIHLLVILIHGSPETYEVLHYAFGFVQNTTHSGCCAAPATISQEGNYRSKALVTGFLRESPLERGASSVVKREEAGCVKIRIPGKKTKDFTFQRILLYYLLLNKESS